MQIPSIEKCFDLIRQMEMMDHIIDHSIMVANVANFICRRLKFYFPALNTDLVTSGALLHDITKTRSFDTKEFHSETGGEMLTEMGYPETGDIVRQHVILDSYQSEDIICEPAIVNYADKRVLHDQVVSLDKRLEYIKDKYGSNKRFRDRFQLMWENTFILETNLFENLDFKPAQLADNIEIKISRDAFL